MNEGVISEMQHLQRPNTIQRSLNKFQRCFEEDTSKLEGFIRESPMLRDTKRQNEKVLDEERQRVAILRGVSVFQDFDDKMLSNIALNLELCEYQKNQSVIVQDDIGEDFFILEEGTVVVRRKTLEKGKSKWPKMVSRDIATLEEGAVFGELSLLTREKRSASIVATSDVVKCLKMTKAMYEAVIAEADRVRSEKSLELVAQIIEANGMFNKDFTKEYRNKLVKSMKLIHFPPNSYVVKQNTAGKIFYVLVEGQCKMTITNEVTLMESEKKKIEIGEYFSLESLKDSEYRRPYNILSVTRVSVMCLFVDDYESVRNAATAGQKGAQAKTKSILTSIEVSGKDTKRVTAYDDYNVKDISKVSTYMRTLVCFITFSLYRSVYWKLYRLWLINDSLIEIYGHHAKRITNARASDRNTAVPEIKRTVHWILESKPSDRSDHDIRLLVNLFRYMGTCSEFGFCKGWSEKQLELLAAKVHLRCVPFLCPIFEAGSKDGLVYFLLHGCARTFLPVSEGDNAPTASVGQSYNGLVRGFSEGTRPFTYKYKHDVQPGEFMAEQVLGGMTTKLSSVLSISNCELMVIDSSDYASISASEGEKTVENLNEKFMFLKKCSLFEHYDDYRLSRLAQISYIKEVKKGERVVNKGTESPELCLILQGELLVLSDLDDRSTLTVLTDHDYYGESSVLRYFNPKEPATKKKEFNSNSNSKKVYVNKPVYHYLECFHEVARSVMMVLVIPREHFKAIDSVAVEIMRSTYVCRIKMRQRRADLVQSDQEKNHKDRLSLNSLQLAPKMYNGKVAGGNHFSPGKLFPILESGEKSSCKLLEIPHLDASLDPLLVLAHSRTTTDTRRRQAQIAKVKTFERSRARNLLSIASSASSTASSRIQSLPKSKSLLDKNLKTTFSSLSSLKMMGTTGVTNRTSRGRSSQCEHDDNVDRFHDTGDDISIGDASIGDSSVNSKDSGVRSYYSSFN